ncbi:MAG: hypothetical protein U0871_16975 [Gemmataceae bacterium]
MYQLRWTLEARVDLADAWVAAVDQAAVNRATAQAEAILRSHPYGQAVHRSEGLWRLTVRPLAIFFELDPATRTVTIQSVGTIV